MLALLPGLFMWDSTGPAAAWGLAIKSGCMVQIERNRARCPALRAGCQGDQKMIGQGPALSRNRMIFIGVTTGDGV